MEKLKALALDHGCKLSIASSSDMYKLVHLKSRITYLLPNLKRVKLAIETMRDDGSCNHRG